MRRMGSCVLALLTAACGTGEDIRVRDRDSVLFSGRLQYLEPLHARDPLTDSNRLQVSIGGELGAYGNRGDYTSPTGTKDYRTSIGYAALLAEVGIGDFVIRPKLGLGIVDFAVDGQVATVGEDGIGLLVGVEGRYRIAAPIDLFVRGSSFQRSSLDSSFFECGLGFHPDPHIVLELGYGILGNVIEDAADLFNTGAGADVEAQGLLLSMSVNF